MSEEKRVLKLEVLAQGNGYVDFRVSEQSHRGPAFAMAGKFSHRGISLRSANCPEWQASGTLYVRGEGTDRDRRELIIPESDFARVEAAVAAYNETNGGFGAETPKAAEAWRPERGQEAYYVVADGSGVYVESQIFGAGEQKAFDDFGLIFPHTDGGKSAAEKKAETLRVILRSLNGK